MVSEAKACEIALELPEATQKTHSSWPDFQVRKKTYASLQEGSGIMVLKLPRDEQLAFADAHPDIFDVSRNFAKHGWTWVTLKKVNASTLRHLMRLAWETVAPKKLIREHEASP